MLYFPAFKNDSQGGLQYVKISVLPQNSQSKNGFLKGLGCWSGSLEMTLQLLVVVVNSAQVLAWQVSVY